MWLVLYSLGMARVHYAPNWQRAGGNGDFGQPTLALYRFFAAAGWWTRTRHFLLKPTWRSLPLAMLLMSVAGAIPAIPATLFLAWFLDVRLERIFKDTYTMIASACLGGACHALCVYFLCLLPLEYLRPHLQIRPRFMTYAAASGGALLAASSGFLLAFRARDLLGGARLPMGAPAYPKLAALSVLIVLGITLLVALLRTVSAESEIRERALAEAAALAQAHALQAQINPHFFFNTLTTVSVLAELDGRAAKELVGQLAQLFRYTLACSRFELVTIEQELEFVSNYLLIEQARFRRRLRFEMPPAGGGKDILMPGLTLQPLVENAVRHGIAKRRDGGSIRVSLERSETVCVLTVANQIALSEGVSALNAKDVFRPGHALANTRDRLALAFHGNASLEVTSDGGEWVKVAIRLPITERTV